MLYNVSFMLNGVKEYFIHEHLNGDKNRFVGISENNESYKPGKPVHKMPNNWKRK